LDFSGFLGFLKNLGFFRSHFPALVQRRALPLRTVMGMTHKQQSGTMYEASTFEVF